MASDFMRAMPASSVAEKGIICSILLCPEECCSLCAERAIAAEYFYEPSHQTIFGACMALWDAGKPIDLVSVTTHLLDKGSMHDAGGAAYLSELLAFMPTATNIEHYISILVEKWVSRETVSVCTQQAAKAYQDDDAHGTLDETERKVLGIRGRLSDPKTYTARAVVSEALNHIADVFERKGSISGISTGFESIDRKTDGLHDGEFIVIAARPSHGKTALAMNIAEHIAVDLRLPVAVFSMEMNRRDLMKRMLCSRAGVNLFRTIQGFLNDRDFPALTAAASAISDAPLYIDDQSGISIQELRARARRLKAKFGIRAMFVDYLQLLHSSSPRGKENRAAEVSEISTGLKQIARELNIPLVVLAQISRDFEKRQIIRPRLSDLRESGAIEQDADFVGFIVREELLMDDEADRLEAKGRAELMIAKQRNGPVGDVPLTFLEEFVRFEQRCSEELPI